ncbi:MAG: hypothetical protein HY369_02850 [Candidatus Aenigmarchaeota archaeon]|nr:hypothetical protein [Candidatus Aenigmarchaeota archaeon]
MADRIEETVNEIAAAQTWNERITLIRRIPEEFGKAQHQDVYSEVAKVIYVPHLAPDFAYVHWRDEYELPRVERAYERAHSLTQGFVNVDVTTLTAILKAEPSTLLIFRLLLGFTPQEFAASTVIPADEMGIQQISASTVKNMENGKSARGKVPELAAAVIDRAMRGELFAAPGDEIRSKLNKPDTVAGWETVRKFAAEGVPFPVFLHQRHYGGAFRQILDATSSRRGNLLEDAVVELFTAEGVLFVRTGATNQEMIAKQFGLTVKPAPDFVVYDKAGTMKAMLECKQVNDGGTARDKASRFHSLRGEGMRLGGVPVFAVLAGLGWRRTADALGPVVRDTDGRVFTVQTLAEIMTVEPFPSLKRT